MESKPVAKHIVLSKFKHDITPRRITYIIKGFDNLVNLVEHMEYFEWGEDANVENLQEGFTNSFESNFDSPKGRDAYLTYHTHPEFGKELLPTLEKILVIDYKQSHII